MAGRNSIVKVMTLVAAVFCVMIFTSSAVYAYIDLPGKFGKGSNVWFGGELWVICEEDVVADDNTGQKGILLISQYALEQTEMYRGSINGGWDDSVLRDYLKGHFEKSLMMTPTERNSVLTAVKDYGKEDVGLLGDRFFVFNPSEADEYLTKLMIPYRSLQRKVNWTERRGGETTEWWLRGNKGNKGYMVDKEGNVVDTTIGTGYFAAVRPAFYLDSSQVQSYTKDSEDCYVITFKDGSKSTNGKKPAMYMGLGDVKAWNNSADARWLYFGSENDNGDPAKWCVVGFDGKGLHNTPEGNIITMHAASFGNTWFGGNNEYSASNLKAEIDKRVRKLKDGEISAIILRNLMTQSYSNSSIRVDGIAGIPVAGAAYWPMSCYEADSLSDPLKGNSSGYWWLRSPAANRYAAFVGRGGVVQDRPGVDEVPPDGSGGWCGIRPACRLDGNKILFTSPAVGGKVSGTVGPIAFKEVGNTTTTEWKATIKDSAHKKFTVKPLAMMCDASETVLSYNNAAIGENEYISAIITDQFDNILYYGRFKNCKDESDRSGKIRVELGSVLNNVGKLYFFNEQCNGDKRTDFSSDLQEGSIAAGHDYEFKGFVWTGNDTNGYTKAAAKYKCRKTGCGHEEMVTANMESAITEPTCEGAGKTEYTAFVGWDQSLDDQDHTESKTGKHVDPTGHKWNEATCTTPKTCSVCGTEEGEPLGHKWEFAGFEWTGNEKDGYTAATAKYVCKNNADHKETVNTVTLTEDVIKPTCTEGGKTVYTAIVEKTDSLDGEKHTESKDAKLTDKLGHAWKAATCTTPKTCSVCGTKEGEPLGHKWDEATCTTPKTCSVCGMKEGEPLGHKWNEATCTTPKTCLVCGTKEGEPLGHKWDEATCTTPKTCSVCGTKEGEPLGHKWDDGIVSKEPTTTESGEKLFTCSVCKATRTETIPMLKPDDKEADEAEEDEDLPVVDINKTDTIANFKKKQMKIVFPANKKVDNYRIQYRLAGEKWTSDWSAGKGTYIVKNLKRYSLCEFRIAGYVKLDDGTWIRSKWSKISYRYMSSAPLKTVRAGKKSIKVTWKKDGKSDGYKIQYALKKSMAGKKIITVNGRSKTKSTIKKLKKGKTYFIRIRPIKKRSGKVYLGVLSGIRKAKAK